MSNRTLRLLYSHRSPRKVWGKLTFAVQNDKMGVRVKLSLDSDAYSFASAYAKANGMALGAAVSQLLRQRAERSPEFLITASRRLRKNSRGLLVKAKTGRIITPETVKESSEDEA